MPANRKGARLTAVEYAWRWIGRPYIWGGDDWSGFDCSGYACEILHAAGLIPRSSDYTADWLWLKYFKYRLPEGAPGREGCLALWFDGDRASHVEFMVDEHYCIGASGGGKPRWTVEKLYEKYPVLHHILKPGDGPGANPFYWLVRKMLHLWEADLRNAYIKLNPVDYRGAGYRFVDPFMEVPA